MCEDNAFIVDKDGRETMFLPSVNTMYIENNGLVFENIFSERKYFNGRIKELALVDHKILLEENV